MCVLSGKAPAKGKAQAAGKAAGKGKAAAEAKGKAKELQPKKAPARSKQQLANGKASASKAAPGRRCTRDQASQSLLTPHSPAQGSCMPATLPLESPPSHHVKLSSYMVPADLARVCRGCLTISKCRRRTAYYSWQMASWLTHVGHPGVQDQGDLARHAMLMDLVIAASCQKLPL